MWRGNLIPATYLCARRSGYWKRNISSSLYPPGVRVAPLDSNSVKEVAQMRSALEVVALRIAASELILIDLARIERVLLEGDNAQTIQQFEVANRAFRHALVAPCAMPRLLAMARSPLH